VDKPLLAAKLASLQRCVSRLEGKRPQLGRIDDDWDLQDVIALNLQRAVQLCVDLAAHILADLDVQRPRGMADSFTQLAQCGVISPDVAENLRRAVGLRNIAMHAYTDLDWRVVASVVQNHLGVFKTVAEQTVAWMRRQSPGE